MNKIDQLIISVVDKHAPEKTLRVRDSKSKWITPNLIRLINLKNKFYKQTYQSANVPTLQLIKQYNKFINYVTNQIRLAKREHFRDLISKNDKTFYSTIKQLLVKSRSHDRIESIYHNQHTFTTEKDIANALNDFFVKVGGNSKFDKNQHGNHNQQQSSPSFSFKPTTSETIRKLLKSLKINKFGGIHRISAQIYSVIADLLAYPLSSLINECFSKSIFPDCLKLALVTPIYKKGEKSDPSNYRPISSLPILSKIFEMEMKSQMMKFLEEHNILSNKHFGFRKEHSTEQMLLSVLQNWRSELDKPESV